MLCWVRRCREQQGEPAASLELLLLQWSAAAQQLEGLCCIAVPPCELCTELGWPVQVSAVPSCSTGLCHARD